MVPNRSISLRYAVVGLMVGAVYAFTFVYASTAWNLNFETLDLDIRKIEAQQYGQVNCGNIADADAKILSHNWLRAGGTEPYQVFTVRIPQPPPGSDTVLFLDAIADKARLTVCENGASRTLPMSGGDLLPYSVRDLKVPELAFPLTSDQASKELLLEIEQSAILVIPIKAMEYGSFIERSESIFTVRLMFLSAICMMIFYNTLICLITNYLAFGINAAIVALVLVLDLYLSGLGSAYIWPNHPIVSEFAISISLAVPSLLAPYLFLFFLDGEYKIKKAIKTRYIIWPALSILFLSSMAIIPNWIGLMGLICLWIIVMFYFAIKFLQRAMNGDRYRSIFLLPLFGAVLPTLLLGFLKESVGVDFGRTGLHLTEIGLVFEAVFFTLALAFVIRLNEENATLAAVQLGDLERSVNQQMLHAVDSERKRIASDLHDTAGQGMLAISARLTQLLHKGKFTPRQKSEISRAADYSRGVIGDIRRISHDLHPAMLDHLGWRRAVEELFEQVNENTEIRAELNIDVPEEILSDFQKLHLFRISQEMLANIAKHSGAANCSGTFLVENGRLIARFWDDGKVPVQANQPTTATSMGQMVIDQRVRALNGVVQRDFATGQKNIIISIPLAGGQQKG